MTLILPATSQERKYKSGTKRVMSLTQPGSAREHCLVLVFNKWHRLAVGHTFHVYAVK